MRIGSENIDEAIGHFAEVLTEDQKKKGLLIHAFHKIQKEHNYLPEDEIKKLSRKLEVPLSEVYGAATFYKQFYFSPRGKNVLAVCTGTACHVRGAGEILDALGDEFGINEGETTGDLKLTLETVGCVGCCGLAPVATLNEEVIGDIDEKKRKGIIKQIRRGK